MDKLKFKVYLEFDPEYIGWVADVPSLPGCMAQGKSEEEAMDNILISRVFCNYETRKLFDRNSLT